jgi:hypothetical protein
VTASGKRIDNHQYLKIKQLIGSKRVAPGTERTKLTPEFCIKIDENLIVIQLQQVHTKI